MLRNRWRWFSVFLVLGALFGLAESLVWGQDPSPIVHAPPRISSIKPDSFLVHWDPLATSDYSTHYQVRLNNYLFGASTQQTVMAVTHVTPGVTMKIDYVIYHQGKVLGISSSTYVLMAPDKPQGLYADQITTSTFRLTWLTVPTATEYQVYVNDELKEQVDAPQVRTTLTGMTAGTRVRAKVTARNPSGLSYESDPLFVRLLPPPPSLTVDISQVGQTTFLANWTLLDDVSTYTVYKNGAEHKSVGSQTRQVLVEQCSPGATTTIKLRAFNSTGGSEYSPEVEVLTIPGTPIRPIAYDIGTNSFMLEWIPVTGTKGYKIYQDQLWLLYNVPAGQTKVRCARGFNPGETASMTVTTYNSTGESPHSDALGVKLLSLASATASTTAAFTDQPRSCPPGTTLASLLSSEGFQAQVSPATALTATALADHPLAIAVLPMSDPDFPGLLRKWQTVVATVPSAQLQLVALIILPAGTPAPKRQWPDHPGFKTVFIPQGTDPDSRTAGLWLFDRPGHLLKKEMGTAWLGRFPQTLLEAFPTLPAADTPAARRWREERRRFEDLHAPPRENP